MRGFPVFIDVGHKSPLVFGSSALMTAKTRTLLLRALHVDVVADEKHESLDVLIAEGKVAFHQGLDLSKLDVLIKGRPVVMADPDNHFVAKLIYGHASALGIPVNVPDVSELCSFSLGSIVDRDPVTVCIGTEGTGPVLATRIRAEIEQMLHPQLGGLAKLANSLRDKVAEMLEPGIARRSFWDRFFGGAPAKAFFEEREDDARALAFEALEETADSQGQGKVILVGAGPGDPDLLTVKAVRALKAADVVLYDRLPGTGILALARREAELIEVGKSKGAHSLKQHEISDLLVDYAKQGNVVVRLKGGDPSIFARGGEELDRLQAENIPVEVIPGITAASAVAASVQIPLTHRDLARTVTFLSGHAPDTGAPDFGTLDLAAFKDGQHTLVVYMGASRTQEFAEKLLENGWKASTPVLLVEKASQQGERRIALDLNALKSAEKKTFRLSGPALLLCGEVAGLPLAGDVERITQAVSSLIENEVHHGA
jgi:uroporphyrin-III C-methyltransferase/precorrin-2 dehydrogenase/sirohydrochlorin ferrochelatase